MTKLKLKAHRGHIYATSLQIAEHFDKKHKYILRDIERLTKTLDKLNEPNLGPVDYFKPATYWDAKNERRPMYDVTHQGFELLVMRFTGEKALRWKLAYQNRFAQMEEILRRISLNKDDEQWCQLRLFGKQVHNNKFREAIKAVWFHAQAQGSETGQTEFHMCYANLIKSAFHFENRDALSDAQLEQIIEAELRVVDEIHTGIVNERPYKEIFQKAKEVIETYKPNSTLTKVRRQGVRIKHIEGGSQSVQEKIAF
jgi:Rha family phage regulatory protein